MPGGSKLPAGKADRKVDDDPVLWEDCVGCNWPLWSPIAAISPIVGLDNTCSQGSLDTVTKSMDHGGFIKLPSMSRCCPARYAF